MAVASAAPVEWAAASAPADQVTPRQTFCAPLLSALLFGGGHAAISDIYVHIRDIVPLSARDWEPNPLERRLARWHTSLAHSLHDFVRLGVLREDGPARWGITDKGFAVAKEFALVSNDGVLIDRALLRKRLDSFAVEFEKMYKVVSRTSLQTP